MSDPFERLRSALSDRYAIDSELGRGGMATVYLAHDLKHDRKVAIKVLHPELSATLGAERFLREISIAAKLNHPHILPLLDSGVADGTTAEGGDVGGDHTALPPYRRTALLYYVMPYVEGESLRDRLNRERQLPIEDAIEIAREVAAALSHAHSQGVIHRDIKPENILLSAGEAVVADFGIARAVNVAGGAQLTETGMAVGTPAYMSPEQATAEEVDARSDIYSLGCVLYEMLGGEPPYLGTTPQSILARKLAEPAPGLRSLRETVPEEYENVVLKALARTPADRFTTAEQLVHALKDPGAVTPVRTRTAPSPRPRYIRAMGAAAIVVAAAAIVGEWLSSRSAPTSFAAAELRQLTFVGDVKNVALSPDGEMLAYTRYRCRELTSCGTDLFVQDLSGGEPLPIEITWSDVGFDRRPEWLWAVEWSTDGRTLLLAPGGFTPEDPQGLYSIPRLGGSVSQLAQEQEIVTSVTFRPGDEVLDWIAFPGGTGGDEPPVWRSLDMRSGLTSSPPLLVFASRLEWSPDGRWLATAGFDWSLGSGGALYAILDGAGNVRDSLRWAGAGNFPVLRWGPTGNTLYMTSGPDLYAVDVDPRRGAFNGDPQLAADDLFGSGMADVMADFDIPADGAGIVALRTARFREFRTIVVGLDTVINATFGAASENLDYPAFSPDGESVAYIRRDQLGTNVYARAFERGTERERAVTATPTKKDFLSWSPDGRTLAFIESEEGQFWLTVVDQTGGRPRRLARNAGNRRDYAWLPDGERIVYRSELADLRVTDLEGRTLLQIPLPQDMGRFWDLWVSPGSDSIAVRSAILKEGQNHVYVHVGSLDASVNEWRLRTEHSFDDLQAPAVEAEWVSDYWAEYGTLGWTEEGDLLLFWSLHVGLEESSAVWRLPGTGGPPELVFDLSSLCSAPAKIAMTPDRSRFACSSLRISQDAWMLEDPALARR